MDKNTNRHDAQVQRVASQRGEEIKRLQGELERQQVLVHDDANGDNSGGGGF